MKNHGSYKGCNPIGFFQLLLFKVCQLWSLNSLRCTSAGEVDGCHVCIHPGRDLVHSVLHAEQSKAGYVWELDGILRYYSLAGYFIKLYKNNEVRNIWFAVLFRYAFVTGYSYLGLFSWSPGKLVKTHSTHVTVTLSVSNIRKRITRSSPLGGHNRELKSVRRRE